MKSDLRGAKRPLPDTTVIRQAFAFAEFGPTLPGYWNALRECAGILVKTLYTSVNTQAEPLCDLDTRKVLMKDQLVNVTRTLHALMRQLPAVRAQRSAEALKRHLQLIAHFQRQYDRLAASGLPAAS